MRNEKYVIQISGKKEQKIKKKTIQTKIKKKLR